MASKKSSIEVKIEVKKHSSTPRHSNTKVNFIPANYKTKTALKNLGSYPVGKIMLDELKGHIAKNNK